MILKLVINQSKQTPQESNIDKGFSTFIIQENKKQIFEIKSLRDVRLTEITICIGLPVKDP